VAGARSGSGGRGKARPPSPNSASDAAPPLPTRATASTRAAPHAAATPQAPSTLALDTARADHSERDMQARSPSRGACRLICARFLHDGAEKSTQSQKELSTQAS
jgi:hypothetical protein